MRSARELARMIARDGEGATKLVTVTVAGARRRGRRREGRVRDRRTRRWSRRRCSAATRTGAGSPWRVGQVGRRARSGRGSTSSSRASRSAATARRCRSTRTRRSRRSAQTRSTIEVDLHLGDGEATVLDLRPDLRVRAHQRRVPKLAIELPAATDVASRPPEDDEGPARQGRRRSPRRCPGSSDAWGKTVVIKYGGAAMTDPALREQVAERHRAHEARGHQPRRRARRRAGDHALTWTGSACRSSSTTACASPPTRRWRS